MARARMRRGGLVEVCVVLVETEHVADLRPEIGAIRAREAAGAGLEQDLPTRGLLCQTELDDATRAAALHEFRALLAGCGEVELRYVADVLATAVTE